MQNTLLKVPIFYLFIYFFGGCGWGVVEVGEGAATDFDLEGQI